VVFANGDRDRVAMRLMRVDPRDVMAEMRQQGISRLDDVESASVEHSGAITLVPKHRGGSCVMRNMGNRLSEKHHAITMT
jgi:uncharacterized membrane protein YcaP (DUF421 family)